MNAFQTTVIQTVNLIQVAVVYRKERFQHHPLRAAAQPRYPPGSAAPSPRTVAETQQIHHRINEGDAGKTR